VGQRDKSVKNSIKARGDIYQELCKQEQHGLGVRVTRPREGRNYGTCPTVLTTSHKLSSKINVMISHINQSPEYKKGDINKHYYPSSE
jgi:hypothetical protein